jgi:dethiobiotin synthetase
MIATWKSLARPPQAVNVYPGVVCTTTRFFSSNDKTDANINPSRFWAYDALTGRAQRPIFVAATKQHVGKTTTCLALLSGLQKRFNQVGFLKPVGQQHVEVTDKNHNSLRVDKDVVLIKEHFHLDHVDYRYMSPVIIPRGYTKQYVDGEITLESQKMDVENAMEQVAADSDITLIEGTGHCAVGSIVGLNNAKVASLLGADMVLM